MSPQTLVLEHLVLPGDAVWEVTEPLGVGDLRCTCTIGASLRRL